MGRRIKDKCASYRVYTKVHKKPIPSKSLSPRQRTDVGIGVFRPGLLRPEPLADGSLLEAVTYASEERSVLVAGVSDGVLESVDQTDIGTETEVNLAVFDSSRSVQTHIEALVSTSLEGCRRDLRGYRGQRVR